MPLAAIFPAPRAPVELREIPLPTLEPGAAMLRTLYSEVCGTDVHLHQGKLDIPFPRAVELAARHGARKPWREMVSGRYTLTDAATALDAVEHRLAIKALVVPNESQ